MSVSNKQSGADWIRNEGATNWDSLAARVIDDRIDGLGERLDGHLGKDASDQQRTDFLLKLHTDHPHLFYRIHVKDLHKLPPAELLAFANRWAAIASVTSGGFLKLDAKDVNADRRWGSIDE